jgi:hypothetical protein
MSLNLNKNGKASFESLITSNRAFDCRSQLFDVPMIFGIMSTARNYNVQFNARLENSIISFED